MSKSVVIAENLPLHEILLVYLSAIKGNGYLEGSKYIVTWALGHLVTLAASRKL